MTWRRKAVRLLPEFRMRHSQRTKMLSGPVARMEAVIARMRSRRLIVDWVVEGNTPRRCRQR